MRHLLLTVAACVVVAAPARAAEWTSLRTEQGRMDEATTLLEASLKASPDLPLAHAALGGLLLRQKQSDQATAHLERAAAAHAADEFVQFYYAAALMERATLPSGTSQGIAVAVELLPDGFVPSR